MGRRKIDGPTHYGEGSRFKPHTMCGQETSNVYRTSNWDRVTCAECLRLKDQGNVLYYGGGRNPRAE